MARGFYIQVRDGKPHVNQSKESDILKTPACCYDGSLFIDIDQLQGGHMAYILSAIVNNKVF